MKGQFCLCTTLWGCRKKNVGVQKETVRQDSNAKMIVYGQNLLLSLMMDEQGTTVKTFSNWTTKHENFELIVSSISCFANSKKEIPNS